MANEIKTVDDLRGAASRHWANEIDRRWRRKRRVTSAQRIHGIEHMALSGSEALTNEGQVHKAGERQRVRAVAMMKAARRAARMAQRARRCRQTYL